MAAAVRRVLLSGLESRLRTMRGASERVRMVDDLPRWEQRCSRRSQRAPVASGCWLSTTLPAPRDRLRPASAGGSCSVSDTAVPDALARGAEREAGARAMEGLAGGGACVVLHRAATQVPFYRAQWAERGAAATAARGTCRELAGALRSRGARIPRRSSRTTCDPRAHGARHTSGTTGTSLSIG